MIKTLIEAYQFNRTRTSGLLDTIEQDGNLDRALGWRPAEGRAHIAWQLMHIGITEELFAAKRLVVGRPAHFEELWPRFQGGSSVDDTIPEVGTIREVLAQSREHLLDTIALIDESTLDQVPEGWQERGLPLKVILQVISWHESHHQGQAHLTYNLFKAQCG